MIPEFVWSLDVFRKAYRASLEIHRMVSSFPTEERFELASQIRRASKSICANLVEGLGRNQSKRDKVRFLIIAIGSCDEVKLWLMYAKDLGYINEKVYRQQGEAYEEIGRMLFGLQKTVGSQPS